MTHIACFCAGAIVALIFALWMITRRKPPSITMHARKAVDVPHTEYRRQWRDAPERREEGVRYEFMNMTGLEDK
jgi:hypothetical protein